MEPNKIALKLKDAVTSGIVPTFEKDCQARIKIANEQIEVNIFEWSHLENVSRPLCSILGRNNVCVRPQTEL